MPVIRDPYSVLSADKSRSYRYPDRNDGRFRRGAIFPRLTPSFRIRAGETVFAIGSCFARNIEEKLRDQGVRVLTLDYVPPKEEWGRRSNRLLNEYNPGTMSQRILAGFGLKELPSRAGLVRCGDGWLDLLLVSTAPVSEERALERRQEVTDLYARLPTADVVVITLGLIEAWHDARDDVFLNLAPPVDVARAEPDRFTVRQLDVDETQSLLEPAFRAFHERGQRVLLTVSPVPLKATFTGTDCAVANGLSKSVLRVCAERLARSYPAVDYFPSFEIVGFLGAAAYVEDLIHVGDDLVEEITRYMLQAYSEDVAHPAAQAPRPDAGPARESGTGPDEAVPRGAGALDGSRPGW